MVLGVFWFACVRYTDFAFFVFTLLMYVCRI